jgi:hypothetical protein
MSGAAQGGPVTHPNAPPPLAGEGAGVRGRSVNTPTYPLPTKLLRCLEPLLVALQIIVGEEHNVPQEIVEVANDLVQQIEDLKKNFYTPR